jgi:hypothetical protein
MGQIRFLTPRHDAVPASALERAYLAGIEGIPWRCRNVIHQRTLVLERAVHESGNLYIPFQVAGYGEITLCTGSLMERERPYLLLLELARGTLNRIRNYVADYQQLGLQLSEALRNQIRQAQQRFVTAATSPEDEPESEALAQQTIQTCLKVIHQLALEGAQFVLELRRQQTVQLPTLLATNLNQIPQGEAAEQALVAAFNTAAIPVLWRDIEPNTGQYCWDAFDQKLAWCQRKGLRVCAGPLLRIDRFALPDWVYLWEEDFDQLQSCVVDLLRTAAQRYLGKIHVWHVAAGMNVGGELDLTEEQRLRLSVAAIDALRSADPQTPVVISFDQPWAEYMAREDYELSPLHFADALARTDLGIAGIGLEINLGYWPHGTLPRDLLEINRMIDRWACLNLPLLIVLTVPGPDPLAWRKSEVVGVEQNGDASSDPHSDFVERLMTLAVSKPAVHGVLWNELSDAEPHSFPHAGLFDGNRRPKPALANIARLRKRYLT